MSSQASRLQQTMAFFKVAGAQNAGAVPESGARRRSAGNKAPRKFGAGQVVGNLATAASDPDEANFVKFQ